MMDDDGDQIMDDAPLPPAAAAAAASATGQRTLDVIAKELVPEICIISNMCSSTGTILRTVEKLTAYKRMIDSISRGVASLNDPARDAVDRLGSLHMGGDDYQKLKNSIKKLNDFMQANRGAPSFDLVYEYCINILGAINGTLLHVDRNRQLFAEFIGEATKLAEQGLADGAVEALSEKILNFVDQVPDGVASAATAHEFLSREAAQILLRKEYSFATGLDL
jgi:hypothetical protein